MRAKHLKTNERFVLMTLDKSVHALNIKLFVDWLRAVLRLTKVARVLSIADVIETD